MASLIDTLIDTLEKENKEYESLLELGLEKTGIIMRRFMWSDRRPGFQGW